MAVPTIFDLCVPRDDVLDGTSSDSDYAADLSHVVRGKGTAKQYSDPGLFFANTYPTRGLQNLLANVCGRLTSGGGVSAIFRLDTSYGGGKTHGLIALAHAAQGMKGVPNVGEFIDPALVPSGKVRIAAFDGENADPANGRKMGDGVLAYTPWGEIAYALAGKAGYERVRASDAEGMAPGAETIAELFGDDPALILLDELSIYLRKVHNRSGARDQLTAFLTALFKAIESSPRAALVYTLAIGKGGKATDAYSDENEFIADKMAEAESVSARKATLLNPTEDDETVHVLRRRLFKQVDEDRAAAVIDAYRSLWNGQRESLSPEAGHPETLEAFRASYPLHPEVLATFTGKTATLANFQRVRGMLRMLGRTVARLWETRPADATAIHLHHIDLGYEPIRQEIVTRLQQAMYGPAIRNDIAGDAGKKALAQEIDEEHFRGSPPYTTYVARTVFMHTLAFNEQLKGIGADHLRYSMLGPWIDIGFIESARQKFIADSAYLDDRPTAPMRFLADANLTQIIRRDEQAVDPGELRAQLNDRIKSTFSAGTFESICFPGGPFDVPDEIGTGKPLLVVLSQDACSVGGSVDQVPDLVGRIFERKGSEGAFRALRNNLVFVVADESRIEEIRHKMARRLALLRLKAPERLAELADYQQAKVRELEARSETEAAIAIQHCFRHVFYPSRNGIGDGSIDLNHTALEIHSASEKPGAGQQQVVRQLRDLRKLRTTEDQPDSPTYVRDRTPLKKGQITTAQLRDEFRRDASLPMLIGDDVFIRGIRTGVDDGEYVYRRGDLVYGPGDPYTEIFIDEQSAVFTMAWAKEHGVWPRPTPEEPKVAAASSGAGAAASGVGSTIPSGHGTVGDGQGVKAGGAPDTGAPAAQLHAEGVLREALTRIWEQARTKKIERLAALHIRMFDVGDGFKLLGVIGALKGPDQKIVAIQGAYETKGGSSLEIEFRGVPADAGPVKDFLDPQLRAAAEKKVEVRFVLSFEAGLELAGDAAEKLTAQLTRYSTGAAYVEATAEAKP